MRQQILEFENDTPATLDNFVVGRNAEVISQLRQWQSGHLAEKQLYLWGESGAGKTHLLRALVAASEFIPCTSETRFEPSSSTVLAVDDVHFLDASGAVDLFHRYNERRDGGAQLLVSGPCPPARLTLFPDLRTRLAWGLVLRITPLNDDEKITALQIRAHSLGLTLPPAVAHYLLTHCPRQNSYLFALMNELNRWSLSTHRAHITLPMVREVLHTRALSD
ncbi:MAG: DnaA regulatory inactivator Hda [Ferrovum sp.]|nr:DnaA regulatory inactivator Hda [Ferrovum sp.]NDU87733.1 DnaA regulatory inactivator Hda [Ferrovum sp.]